MNTEASHDWRVLLGKAREIRLANGLEAVVLPSQGIGSIVCEIYYAGGSAADPPGRSGLTHFLEHMLFNGTRCVPRGELDRLMLRLAGQHNAETSPDFCRFWSQLPRPALELALALEADRMCGAVLDDTDFLRERQVILEEEARYREQPFEELMTRLMADLFAGHPYAYPTIGTPEDLLRISADDLRDHYRRMFCPSNAVVVVAGDTTTDRALKLVEKHFEKFDPPRSEAIASCLKPPPVDRFDGRLLTVDSSELVPRGVMLWPAPGPFDLKARPWGIAVSVLGGGRSSRLWRKLVEETQVAAYVNVSLSEERLGGYLMVELELHPGKDPRKAETIVQSVLDELALNGPTSAELRRVAAQRSAAACWARQQTHSISTAIGTWRLFSDLASLSEAWRLDDLVTIEEVARLASILKPENSARGWTVPQRTNSVSASNANTITRDASRSTTIVGPTSSRLAEPLEKLFRGADRARVTPGRRARPNLRFTDSGAILLAEPIPDQGVCAIELRWRHGALEESIPGLALLTARVFEESASGTGGISFGERFEELGAPIDSGASGFSIQGRADDLDEILSMFLEMIARPDAKGTVSKRVALRTRTELEADMDDPAFQAERLLKEMTLEGLPGSTDARGTPESLKSIRIRDIRRQRSSWYLPSNMILGVAGDFRADRFLHRLDRQIRDAFACTNKKPTPPPISPDVFGIPLPPARLRTMRSPGTQTHIVMGHRTIERTHPDWVALQVLEIVLGSGPGLTDLLSRRLREELGIVYGVNMSIAEGAWYTPGHMRVGFSCDPADAPKAESETIQVLADAAHGRLADEDCLQARDHLAHSWYLGYESADDRLSSRLDAELEDWDLRLPPRWARICESLTADDIRAAARRHIKPGFLQIVRYGP